MKCSTCHKDLPEEDFCYRNKITRKRSSVCRNCARAYHVQYYKDHPEKQFKRNYKYIKSLRELIQKIKEETPCRDCGKFNPYYRVDFDHVRGEKLCDVSRLLGVTSSKKKIFEEIAKCDVVCALCHRDRTHKRRMELTAGIAPATGTLRKYCSTN